MGGVLKRASNLSEEQEEALLSYECSVRAIATYISEGRAHSIVCMCGAGISVSAGIPDFRTPGTGLYANLLKYKLPRPECMFDIEYFRANPLPFYDLARELYPDNFKPTPTHFFIRLLQEKGLLRRCYTQNIDTLERAAGINPELLVEAHGSFGEAHCIACEQHHTAEYVKEQIHTQQVCRCTSCGGFVKPDIVFFGENLPARFFELKKQDLPAADLLIVMGTSLKVSPFNLLVEECSASAPRLLINMERVGEFDEDQETGFKFDMYDNYRDVELLGGCDDGVRLLCDLLGWRDELETLIRDAGGSALPVDEHPIPLESEVVTHNYRWANILENSTINAEEPQTSVPFVSAMAQTSGTVDRQITAFKDETGKLELYRWVAATGAWESIGPVERAINSTKTALDGVLYDMVVPVEVDSASKGYLELQLGFNKDCDSVQVAIEFCSKHSLGDEYIEQITSFVDMYKQAL